MTRTDLLRSVCRFWGHVILAPKFKKGRTRKTNVLHKNEQLPSITLFSKLNLESEHINAVNRTKIYHSTLIFLCFRQYLDKKSRNMFSLVVNNFENFASRRQPMVAPRFDSRLGVTLPTPKLEL